MADPAQVADIEEAVQLAQEKVAQPDCDEVGAFEVFYPAEDYHQAYYELNKEKPYCRAVIAPKMAKFQRVWVALRPALIRLCPRNCGLCLFFLAVQTLDFFVEQHDHLRANRL